MATHLAAWQANADQVSLTRITTVTDDVLTPDGTTRFLVPNDYNSIMWMAATGPSLTDARVVTPSLDVRRENLVVIPREDGDEQFTLASPAISIPQRPVQLITTESIEFRTAEDGGTTQQNGLVALGTGDFPPMPDGDIRTVIATGSTTLVAHAWTSVTDLTLETSLEPGTYSLVNFFASSATGIAARVIFQGGGYRPGLPALEGAADAAANVNANIFQRISWYDMGSFTHITVPVWQYFAQAGDTSETVVMNIIRTGDL